MYACVFPYFLGIEKNGQKEFYLRLKTTFRLRSIKSVDMFLGITFGRKT